MFYFTKYFIEIKHRLILILISCVSTTLVCFFYKEIFLFLIIPNIFISKNKQLAFFYFIFTDVKEVLTIYFMLITFLTFQIFFFFIIYHFFVFTSPALFQSEFLYFKYKTLIIGIVWLTSFCVATYYIIPLTWNFFLSFQKILTKNSITLHFEAKIKEYIYFYTKLYYLCWLYFQSFVFFFYFLTYIIINIAFIRKYRKANHYCFIVFSTVISPVEILSQIFLSLIAVCIYELLLFCFLLKIYLKSLIR